MPSAANVDLVLVIDTSASMRPCIEALKTHLRDLIKPMQGYVAEIRFGLVGLSASKNDNGGVLYYINTLAGDSKSLDWLYSSPQQYNFFTKDPDELIKRLDKLTIAGDEDNLVALDIAIDHPFGPSSNHKRVIALFSDEPIEQGARRNEVSKDISQIIEKLHARHIKLFCAIPYSDSAMQLAQANGSEIEDVGNAAGLTSVDFKTLLTQLGKSISVSSLQGSSEEKYTRALFGQDKWIFSQDQFKDIDLT